MDFKFINEYPTSRIDEIVSFLLGPRLWIPQTDYPDFFEWAEKLHKELCRESKRAMIALSHGNVVGVAIYQKHKKITDALEIKNLTVGPEVRGRHIASFLLRNTELEGASEFKSRDVVCDAKAHNLAIRFFLHKHQYKICDHDDLYGLNAGKDIVYKKQLLIWNKIDKSLF